MGVATAVAVGGLAISAATTANSFIQAGEQKNKQRQAEAAAQAAMDAAKRKLQVNYTDELAIHKEPYELQREAMLSQGAQAIEAGQESDRGAQVTAGKVQMAQNEAQAGIRTEMGKDLTDIQNKQVQEQSRLRDLGVQLDLGEVEGQQLRARDAEEASTAATQQGIQGAISTAQQGLNMMPLYFKDSSGTGATTPKFGADTTVSTNKNVINNVNTAAQSSMGSLAAGKAADAWASAANPFMPYSVQGASQAGQAWQNAANPWMPK